MDPIISIQSFCRAEAAWAIDTIETFAHLESPTTDKAAVDRCGAAVAERLAQIGATVKLLRQPERGDHLHARFGTGDVEAGQILLLGHIDTVWPVGQIERMPVERRDGKLYGPGVFDMKTGIALGMLAVRALITTAGAPRRPIVMLWTTDEEMGSGTSREIIEEEARRSAAVLVLEPSLTGGALKTARKGCGEYELVVRGVAAHAGIDPTRGASAIHELARQIIDVQRLQDLARGVSVNVGVVSGGTRPNVIAEEAHATIDVRVPAVSDASAIDAALRRLKPYDSQTRIELAGGIDRPPLERTPAVVRLYEQAASVAASLGLPLGEGSTGGGSDGNFTAALGVPTLDGLGAVGDGAHAVHEHVELAPLPDRAALIAGLLWRLSES